MAQNINNIMNLQAAASKKQRDTVAQAQQQQTVDNNIANALLNQGAVNTLQEGQAMRYSAVTGNNYIPIVFVNDRNLLQPKLENGVFVANANDKHSAGTAAFWDTDQKQISYLASVGATTDYREKLAKYAKTYSLGYAQMIDSMAEQELEKAEAEKIARTWADGTDPNQVNSIADIMSKWNILSGVPLKAVPKAMGALADGYKKNGISGAVSNLFTSIRSEGIETLEAAEELISNMVLSPLVSDTDASVLKEVLTIPKVVKSLTWDLVTGDETKQGNTRTLQMLNNTLNNLSETMDYALGANMIKGAIQGVAGVTETGAVENIMRGAGVSNQIKGRQQFDWNTGIVPADIILEMLTDPSTWVSAGTTSFIKSAGKKELADIITNVSAKHGLEVTQETAEQLATRALKRFAKTDAPLSSTVVQSVSKLVKSGSEEEVAKLATQLSDDLLEATRQFTKSDTYVLMDSVKSIRTATDYLEQGVAKSAFAMSAIGLGPTMLKVVSTMGNKFGIHGVGAMNTVIKAMAEKPLTLGTLEEHAQLIDETIGDALAIVGEDKTEYVNQILADATLNLQRSNYESIHNIITSSTNVNEVLGDLNKWAQKQGVGAYTIGDYITKLETSSAIPIQLKAVAKDIANDINEVYNRYIVQTVDNVDKQIPLSLSTIPSSQYASYIQDLRILQVIPTIKGATQLIDDLIDAVHRVDYAKYDTVVKQLRSILDDTKKTVQANRYGLKDIKLLDDEAIAKVIYSDTQREVDIKRVVQEEMKDKADRVDEVLIDESEIARERAKNSFVGINDVFSMDEINTGAAKQMLDSIDASLKLVDGYIKLDGVSTLTQEVRTGIQAMLTDKLSFQDLHNLSNKVKELDTLVETAKSAEPTQFIDGKQKNWIHLTVANQLITMLSQARINKLKEFESVTTDQLKSKIYQLKNSQIESMRQLLNTPNLLNTMEHIRSHTGVGTYVDFLTTEVFENVKMPDGSSLQDAAIRLQDVAESTYIYSKVLEHIHKSEHIPQALKNGLLDALATRSNEFRTDLGPSVEAYVHSLVEDAKRYVDYTRSAKPNLMDKGLNTPNTQANVESIASFIQREAEVNKTLHTTIGDTKVPYEYVTDNGEITAIRLNGKEYARDGESFDGLDADFVKYIKRDMYYSMAFSNGTVREISFKAPDGTTTTFVRSSVPTDMHETATLKYYGQSKKQYDDFIKNMKRDNVIELSDTDFHAQVALYLKEIKSQDKIPLRLVGFNNANDNLGMDQALSTMFSKNKLKTFITYDGLINTDVYSISTVDAAQVFRVTNSRYATLEVSNDSYESLTELFRYVDNYLKQANSEFSFNNTHKISLMPDFGTKTIDTLRTMADVIAGIANGEKANGVSEATSALLQQYIMSDGAAVYRNLMQLTKELGTTLHTIGLQNGEVGTKYIIAQGLKSLANNNVTSLIDKLSHGSGVSPLAVRTLHDPSLITSWYKTMNATTMGTVKLYNEFAQQLENNLKRVTRPQIPLSTVNARKYVYLNALRKAAMENGMLRSTYLNILSNLKLSDGMHIFLVSEWLVNKLKSRFDNKAIAAMLGTTLDDMDDYVYALLNADTVVYGKQAMYTPGYDYLQSHYFKDDDVVLQAAESMEIVNAQIAKAEDYTTALALREAITDATGYNKPDMFVRQQGIKKYADMYNNVRNELDEARHTFEEAVEASNGDPLYITVAQQQYNETLNNINASLEHTANAFNARRIRTIANLSAEDYTHYLYKYALGKQIYKLDAEIYKSGSVQAALSKFSRTLKEAEQYGVRSEYNEKLKEIYIWLDKEVANDETFQATARQFVLTPTEELDVDLPHMKELAQYLDNTTDNAYSLSTHNNFDSFQIDELNNYLEANGYRHVVDNAMSKNYITAHNMDALAYNHTMIGDYNAGVSTIFSNKSTNLLSNVASGFHKTYKLLATKDNYAALFFNENNSLRNFVNQFSGTARDLRQALKDNGYVVAEYTGTRVKQVNIGSTRALQNAIRSGASLLPYRVYTRAIEKLENNQINNGVIRWLNKHYFSITKIGMLLSSGWVLRNIPDSTLKGLMQAGDIHYLTDMTRTMELMQQFDRTVVELYKSTNGLVNEDAIAKFFAENANNADILPEALYRKMYEFSNSTSSMPTALQEGLVNDILDNLKRYVDEQVVSDDELKAFIKYIRENPTATAQQIMEYHIHKYGADKGAMIARLQHKIPKQLDKGLFQKLVIDNKISPAHWMMEGSKAFERFIRTHTFLYWSEYTNGTVSDAYKKVDASQFNRAIDSKLRKVTETIFPFSSFAIDNMLFWLESFNGKNSTITNMINVIDGVYNSEETDSEELAMNMSLQYMLLQGSIPLDQLLPIDNTGLNLKVGNSVFSAYGFLADPIGTMAGMVHTSIDSMRTVLDFISQPDNGAAGLKEYYDNLHELESIYYNNGTTDDYVELTQEQYELLYSAIGKDEVASAVANLIPLFGVLWQRYTSAIKKTEWADEILPNLLPHIYDTQNLYVDKAGWITDPVTGVATLVAPSILGVTKMSEAGTWQRYNEKPVGFNWYQQTQEYRDTHRFIPGISYVPSFLAHDPVNYVDTYGRLLKMGYTQETASQMMQNGWYIKDKSFILINYNDYGRLPYWITADSETYKRTQERLLRAGYSLEETRNLMIEGWYMAQNGELVDRGEQNQIDQEAWEQLKLFQQGLAPFPTQYVTQANRVNSMGDGLAWEQAFIQRNGFAPSEMWLNPETGEIYFKGGVSFGSSSGTYQSTGTYNRRRYNSLPRGPRYRKPRAVSTKRRKKYKATLNKANMPKTYRDTKWQGSFNIYKELYAKYGARRSDMLRYRGTSRSGITLFRDTVHWDMIKNQRAYRRF